MIECIELNQAFETKEAMYAELVKKEKSVIDLKRAAIQKSAEKGQLSVFNLFKVTEETKSLLGLKEGYIYPVINTTKYLDSHGDVHENGIWDKSAKEQKGGIYYVADHELKTRSVIAWPGDVNVMIKTVPWSFVGKEYEGDTQALIYEIKEDSIENEDAKKIIAKRRPVQNSVRMQYVKIKLAINSEDKEFAAYKINYDNAIEGIANKETAEERGYFWLVSEAKISKEGSMVIFGSNDATPLHIPEAASKGTSDTEPDTSTQTEEQKTINELNLF